MEELWSTLDAPIDTNDFFVAVKNPQITLRVFL
jgi:hypothetical protein